jgi:ketosteroid isomerase-like protein
VGYSATAVSQANIDLLKQRYYDVYPAIIGFIGLLDPDIVWDSPDFLDQGTYHGREGVARFLSHIPETWSNFRVIGEEFIDVSEDKVLVLSRLKGNARIGGAPFEQEVAHVWTLHDGKVVHMRIYRDRAAALEAVGLQN